jgi:hypothetical protein
MVGENRDDVCLYYGLTREDMVASYIKDLADNNTSDGDFSRIVEELEFQLYNANEQECLESWGAQFALSDDSKLYSYKIIQLQLD